MLKIIEQHPFHFPFVRYSDRSLRRSTVVMVPNDFGDLVPVASGATLHSLCS